MIDRKHALSLKRQAEVLRLSHSTLYYRPRTVLPAALASMRRVDGLHLDRSFAASRMLRDNLRGEGIATAILLIQPIYLLAGYAFLVRPNLGHCLRDYAMSLIPAFMIAGAMGALVLTAGVVFPLSRQVIFLVQVALGIVAYAGMTLLFERRRIREVRAMLFA